MTNVANVLLDADSFTAVCVLVGHVEERFYVNFLHQDSVVLTLDAVLQSPVGLVDGYQVVGEGVDRWVIVRFEQPVELLETKDYFLVEAIKTALVFTISLQLSIVLLVVFVHHIPHLLFSLEGL